jgi:glycosyltransferase involved in cell wall biosynthesis
MCKKTFEKHGMKILLITTHMNLGGIGIYTLSLARALQEIGEQVTVASSGGQLIQDLRQLGIGHIQIPVNTSSDIGPHTLWSYFKLKLFVQEQGIDIIHAQTRVTQIIAHMLSKKTDAVFVSTCHGFFKNKLFRRLLPCWGCHSIAISEAVRQHLVCDFKIPKEQTSLIHNGIDIKRFNPEVSVYDKTHIRRQLRLDDGPVVGIISRLSAVKGHKYLLDAFAMIAKKIDRAQLLVIGDGPKKYRNSLESQADFLKLSSKIKFHPACKDTAAPLCVIDVFCHPSLQEGLGLSILEAMAMKIPVVASDVGGIYTLIKHKVNGLLVASMDYEALADGVIEILSDCTMARQMGERSRKIVEENFTLDIMRDKVVEVYRNARNS